MSVDPYPLTAGVGTHKPRDDSPTAASHEVMRAAIASAKPVCAYCLNPDPTWSAEDLGRGKRAIQPPGCGVEYHCMHAFYEAS